MPDMEDGSDWNVESLKELHDRMWAYSDKVAAERDLRYQDMFRTWHQQREEADRQIAALRSRMDAENGRHSGSDVTMSKVIAIVGMSTAVMTVIISIVVLFATRVI